MRRGLSPRAGAVGLAALAIAAPFSGRAAETLTIQAVSRTLSEPIVRAVASAAAPTEASDVSFDVTTLKPGDVVRKLCGSIQPGYLDEVETLNKRAVPADTTVGEIEKQRGSDAGLQASEVRLRWPACVVLRNGGAAASKPGTVPSPADAPPTIIRPRAGTTLDHLANALDIAIGAIGENYEIEYERTVPPPTARVTTAVDASNGGPTTFPPCTSKVAPYDPQRVAAYYDLALGFAGKRDKVVVWVFDNGFYGQNTDRTPEWSAAYPEEFFADWSGQDGRTGPAYKVDGNTVYPSNYAYVPTPTLLSGHGTHVAGLAMGGPGFQPYRSRFYLNSKNPKPEEAWLRLGVINLARGSNTLIGGSQKEVASLLKDDAVGKYHGRIVNLSLVYEEAEDANIPSTFTVLYARSRDLFVVAAGNDGKPLILTQYPAKLGGPGARNVITVAAHNDEDSPQLTSFSNWGPTVDLAAPGCSVSSWISMDPAQKPLSGTSQATPLVTFTAALLRSLDDEQWPSDLKVRLIASADQLIRDDAPKYRLNIAKALLFKLDYIELNTGEIYAGKLERLRGLRCAKDKSSAATDGLEPKDILAYKTGPTRPALMYAGMLGVLECPPDIAPYPNSAIQPYVKFTPFYRLDPIDPQPDANGQRTYFRSVSLSTQQFMLPRVKELVLRSPPPGHFQPEGQ